METDQVLEPGHCRAKTYRPCATKGVLEFGEVPKGNIERLKEPSLSKKRNGEEKLKAMSLKFQ
jgi:hypothetical protein